MSTESKGFEKLLAQQQRFAENMLEQQQQWMQSILDRTGLGSGGETNLTGRSTVCPPFPSFNKDNQKWESYLQHFQAYSVVTAEKRKAYFLSWIGAYMFELLKNLFGSQNEYTYEQLANKFTENFQTKRHIVAARYEFFKREMGNSQTHRQWVADLRGIARECQFLCSAASCSLDFVDEMIRNQIIVHTPFDTVRAGALQKLDVLLIAESYETTTKTVAVIKENNERQIPVNAMNSYRKRQQKCSGEVKTVKNTFKSCSGCGHTHSRAKCKFRDAICHKCGKRSHCCSVFVKTN